LNGSSTPRSTGRGPTPGRSPTHTQPHAIARSFDPAPIVVEPEGRTCLGLARINVAEAAPAGSLELAWAAVAALGPLPATLLSRHGAVSVAGSPRDAVEVATVVEHQAQIALLLNSVGVGAV
jgi:L-fuculose-phosphate aldolase